MRRLLLLILLFTLFLETYSEEIKAMTFGIAREIDDPVSRWYIDIYKEAFSRLGLEFQYTSLPVRRLVLYCDTGQIDGDMGRVPTYSEKHPNLIMVEEPIRYIVFSAFSLNKDYVFNNWKDFEGKNIRVEYRLGIKEARDQLNKYVAGENLSIAKDGEEGMKKLLNNRIDVFVDIEDDFNKYLDNLQANNKKVYKVGDVKKISTHLYLYKRHKELAPKLSQVLKAMKEEGRFKYYADKNKININ